MMTNKFVSEERLSAREAYGAGEAARYTRSEANV